MITSLRERLISWSITAQLDRQAQSMKIFSPMLSFAALLTGSLALAVSAQ